MKANQSFYARSAPVLICGAVLMACGGGAAVP